MLAAALLLGILALAAPLLPLSVHASPDTVRLAGALAAGVALFLFTTLVVGPEILVENLITGREGFHLARPVGALQLWAGRMAAVLVVSLATPLLALLPAGLLVGVGEVGDAVTDPSLLYPALLVPAAVTAAALVRLMVRVRSPWVLVLLSGIVGAGWAWYAWILVPSIRVTFAAFRVWPLLASPVSWSLALLAGSAAAAVRGRLDPSRASAAGAVTSVALLALSTVLFVGTFRWALAAGPSHIQRITLATSAPRGPWVTVLGTVRRAGLRFRTTFLTDVRRGLWVSRQDIMGGVWNLAFSGDGHRVAISSLGSPASREGPELVSVLELPSGPDGRPSPLLSLGLPERPLQLALSPQGTRLLALFGDHLTVWDTDTGAPVTRARGATTGNLLALVDDDGSVWLVLPSEGHGNWRASGVRVARIGPGDRFSSPVWRLETRSPKLHILHPAGDPGGEVVALAVRGADETRWITIRRLRTGEELWRSPLPDTNAPLQVLPLEPERVLVLVASTKQGVTMVRLATPAGTAWSSEVEGRDRVHAVPGPREGTALLCWDLEPGPAFRKPRTALLDLSTGETTPLGDGLRPAAIPWLHRTLPQPGTPGSRLLIREERELVLLGEGGSLVPVPLR